MTKTTQTEALADRLLTLAKANGGLRRLSDTSGIAYSTLRSQLIYEPSRLTVQNAFRMTTALDVKMSELV